MCFICGAVAFMAGVCISSGIGFLGLAIGVRHSDHVFNSSLIYLLRNWRDLLA